MKLRSAALLASLSWLSGCINFWQAYEDPPASGVRHDPHEPRTLARSMLGGSSLVTYSDDGEHFGVRLCKVWRDKSMTCELGFGTRGGLNELWPVQAPAPTLDGAGANLIVAVLASRLDDIDAHLMEDRRTGGKSGSVSAATGFHRVTLEGNIVRLAHVASPGAAAAPFAAAKVESDPPSEIAVNGSFRRRDAVAVELWHDVADGPVARFNQWVLFFREGDGTWKVVPVRGLVETRGIYAAPKDALPDPPPAAVPLPPAASPPSGPAIAE